MKRPKTEDFKVKYNRGDAELCSLTKQYSKAQDEYIDYLKRAIKERLIEKQKQLEEVREIKNNKVFKNSDSEIQKIENQLIGEIQILRQLIEN